jgi:hypothetical protein
MRDTQYKGQGDIFNFNGGGSFIGEHQTGMEFGMELRNTSSLDKFVAFAPGLSLGLSASAIALKIPGIDAFITKDGAMENVEGSAVTGLADPDGGTSGALSANSLIASNPLQSMLNFVAINPHRIVRMNLQSNQPDQFATTVEQSTLNPFKRSNGTMSINLRNQVNADQFQKDRAEIPLLAKGSVLTLATDVVIVFKLKANSSMQMNWDIGASFSASHILRYRAGLAQANISAEYNGSLQTK